MSKSIRDSSLCVYSLCWSKTTATFPSHLFTSTGVSFVSTAFPLGIILRMDLLTFKSLLYFALRPRFLFFHLFFLNYSHYSSLLCPNISTYPLSFSSLEYKSSCTLFFSPLLSLPGYWCWILLTVASFFGLICAYSSDETPQSSSVAYQWSSASSSKCLQLWIALNFSPKSGRLQSVFQWGFLHPGTLLGERCSPGG